MYLGSCFLLILLQDSRVFYMLISLTKWIKCLGLGRDVTVHFKRDSCIMMQALFFSLFCFASTFPTIFGSNTQACIQFNVCASGM